jgi:hypothetical protein
VRWAVFKDFRGVAYCEPVNEGINVWILDIAERGETRNWWGKITREARAPTRRQKAVFDDTIYSRDRYCASAFEPAPEGYEFRDDIRYLKENRWGPVKVLAFIEDDEQGQRLSNAFRKLHPIGDNKIYNDKQGKPHPKTDEILEKLIKAVGSINLLTAEYPGS